MKACVVVSFTTSATTVVSPPFCNMSSRLYLKGPGSIRIKWASGQ
jgi:hypothetical protein